MSGITPAIDANNEVCDGLERLDRLAKAGDKDAIRLFHETTCGMVARLNELHLDFAQSVLEWPVLLPQDRDARRSVTDRAKKMRIGSVKAGDDGAPEKLEYSSQKGFAIQNIRRVSFARAVLLSLKYGTDDAVSVHDLYELDEDDKPAWRMEWERCAAESKKEESDEVARTMAAFSDVTGIAKYDDRLLLEIHNLPDYDKRTQEQWVDAILILLDMNPELVPEALAARSMTIRRSRRPDGSQKKEIDERGRVLKDALNQGLKNVLAVPGCWSGARQ